MEKSTLILEQIEKQQEDILKTMIETIVNFLDVIKEI